MALAREPIQYFLVEMDLAADTLTAIRVLDAAERPRLVIFGPEETYFLDRDAIEPILCDPLSYFPRLESAVDNPGYAVVKPQGKLEVEGHASDVLDSIMLQGKPVWLLMQPGEWTFRAGESFSDLLYVRTDDGIKRLRRQDLLVVEAQKDYLQLTARDVSYRVLRSLKSIEARLDPAVHCRVHRSYIVLLSAIHSLDQDLIWLDGIQEPIPVGPSYRKELFARLEII